MAKKVLELTAVRRDATLDEEKGPGYVRTERWVADSEQVDAMEAILNDAVSAAYKNMQTAKDKA